MIIQCPKCRQKLRIPYKENKRLLITCKNCSNQFEYFPVQGESGPGKKKAFFPEIRNFFSNSYNSVKYFFFRWKKDPYFKEKIKTNSYLPLIIIAGLIILNFILRIIVRY